MTKIKAIITLTYSTVGTIEVTALFSDVNEYDSAIDYINSYLEDGGMTVTGVIRLIPYNEDINGEYLATDLLITLENLVTVKTVCTVIEYKEPIR